MNTEAQKRYLIASYLVPVLEHKVRLQDFAPGIFKTLSTKSGIKKAIKRKQVRINDKIAATGDFLIGGETINLYQNPEIIKKPTIAISLEIIYEDAFLAMVNKPAGITVSGTKKWTLENALSNNLLASSEPDALIRPEPIHRLDHPTSGILLIGKTSSVVIALNKLFENREIKKSYFAVSISAMDVSGIIETPIDSKKAKTTYFVKEKLISPRFGFLNLVELHPLSGRKHQLRKHLSELGNPILGDTTYGKKDLILFGNGLYLHAFSLEFTHPITKEKLKYSAPLPKKIKRLFETT